MTWRIYLRHPQQRVSDKTVTDDRSVADLALRRLVYEHVGLHAAAVKTRDGQQEQYVRLDEGYRVCEKCRYRGPFVDGGETCPYCALVQ